MSSVREVHTTVEQFDNGRWQWFTKSETNPEMNGTGFEDTERAAFNAANAWITGLMDLTPEQADGLACAKCGGSFLDEDAGPAHPIGRNLFVHVKTCPAPQQA